MILYYSPRSPFVRKVMIALHETGLTARVEQVRSVTMMLKPNAELMKVNPWNKIPTLIADDGQVLFDSDVIIEYLDTLHTAAKLHPQQASWRWKRPSWPCRPRRRSWPSWSPNCCWSCRCRRRRRRVRGRVRPPGRPHVAW